MRHFAHLRTTPWEPVFEWVATPEIAADLINRPHEDYPRRVPLTVRTIKLGNGWQGTSNRRLTGIHHSVFRDMVHRGRWREVNVSIERHVAPHWQEVPHHMSVLGQFSNRFLTTEGLKDWYWDFETIHPFQDGNGRVGGIVVAAISHALEPEHGWLAAPN